MTNNSDRRPFSMPYVNHVVTLGAVNNATMIARAPWPAPVSKYFVLRKLVATVNPNAVSFSGGILGIWDQDLSNTTPISRGSGGGPLLVIPLVPSGQTALASGQPIAAGASMTILDIDSCPQESFFAGITCQASISGVGVSFEADVV